VNGMQLVIAVNGSAERASPSDIGGEGVVGDLSVVSVPARLQFADEARDGCFRLLRRIFVDVEDQSWLLDFVGHSASIATYASSSNSTGERYANAECKRCRWYMSELRAGASRRANT
jgi:hypothetical protein